jgi:hypothetical protein
MKADPEAPVFFPLAGKLLLQLFALGLDSIDLQRKPDAFGLL